MLDLSTFVEFVLNWVDKREIRELERIFANSSSEHRFDLDKRRRVAEMSREEMQRELLTSEVTNLPNRRAFGCTPLLHRTGGAVS